MRYSLSLAQGEIATLTARLEAAERERDEAMAVCRICLREHDNPGFLWHTLGDFLQKAQQRASSPEKGKGGEGE